jgi:hypothetical protein
MAPESPGNLIALDLKWNNSRLECEVDRYDSGSDFLYVSWNALECPEYYVPFGNGVAYVWVPEKSFAHRRYRARVDIAEHGFEWLDVAQASSGAMLILTLPPNHVFMHPTENDAYPFPVSFKSTEDGRMALYWWLPPGRFTVVWNMEDDPNANIEEHCQRLIQEARRRQPPGVAPVHIDRPGEKTNAPSAQPPIIHEPPPQHITNIFLEGSQQINRSGGVDLHSEGDINTGGDVIGRDKAANTQ